MRRLVAALVPAWMTRRHPVTRYVLRQATLYSHRRWVRVFGCLSTVLFIGLTLVSTAAAYANGSTGDFFLSDEAWWFVIPYFFLLLVQVGTLIGAPNQVIMVGLTLPNTPADQRRESWELVKVTTHGAELVTRARWITLLYRTRGVLLVVLLPRLIYVGLLVARWARSGETVRATLATAAPGVAPLPGGVLLGVLLVGITLIFPALLVFGAAYGLVLSTAITRPWSVQLIQQVVAVCAVTLFMGAMLFGWSAALYPETWRTPYARWQPLCVLGMLVFGDQGLRLLSWDALLSLLGGVRYSLWLGVPLLALAVGLIALAIWLLNWAAQRASQPTRE